MAVLGLCFQISASAQQQQNMTPEEREKALFDNIDKEIERLTSILDLADWQVFMVDSTLTHDYKALTEEYETLRKTKVSNSAAYVAVGDKWTEAIYQTYQRIFNEEQWARYLKSGAAKEKKARDKRAMQAQVNEEKLKAKVK